METRTLGSSGLLVSSYALGTMTFGNETDEADAFAILDRFVEAGGTLLDLADVYVEGGSERIVGRWLADRGLRDEVVLATKARFPVGGHGDPNRQGLSRAWLHRAINDSLRRLGLEHIELYQIHAWDPLTPVEEWLGAMDEPVQAARSTTWACPTSAVTNCGASSTSPAPRGSRRWSVSSRSTTCSPARSSGNWCPAARTNASGCCRGRRSAAVG